MTSSAEAPWKTALKGLLEKHKDDKDISNVSVGTVEDEKPRVRYQVHRGFVPDARGGETDLLLSTTDIRMPKVAQIRAAAYADPTGAPVEYVFWLAPAGEQFRIQGRVHLFGSPSARSGLPPFPSDRLAPGVDWESLRQEEWAKMSGHLRASFLRPQPGSSVEKPEEAREWKESVEAGEEEAGEGLERFTLFVVEPEFVDRVRLAVMPNERYQYDKKEDGTWVTTQVVP